MARFKAAAAFCVRDRSGIGSAWCRQLEWIARPAARPGTPKHAFKGISLIAALLYCNYANVCVYVYASVFANDFAYVCLVVMGQCANSL